MESQDKEYQVAESSKAKKSLLLALSFLVIFAVSYYIFNINSKDISKQFDINKFRGQVISIEGETIKLRGVYVSAVPLDDTNLSSEREFSFRVGESTVFEKLEIRHPAWEELEVIAKAGGTYDIADLPRFEGAGSFADLKKSFSSNSGIVIDADFPVSIIDSRDPVVSSIFYTIMVIPEAPKIP